MVWITGASSGIGEALVFGYARRGDRIIISARDENKLLKLAEECRKLGAEVKVLPLDLASTDSVHAAYNELKTAAMVPDILINNAGVSQRSKSFESNLDIERKIFEVNFFGTIELTRLLVRDMIQRRAGHICVVSSIAGKFGFPLRSAYSASKHALQGYFESMAAEVRPYGIRISIVSPGRVRTNISLNAMGPDGKPHAKMDEGQSDGVTAEYCASRIMKAIDKKKRDVLIGGKELLMVHIHRYIRPLYYKLLTKIKAT